MHWNKDENDAFPAPHPREPGGLRQDILDEIADHLACAADAEREGDESGNEDTAWRRALERFGDPDAMARRLWWDAMRETVMREWIHTGVFVVLALVGIAGVVFLGLMLRQFGATNEAVLTALANQGAGEARWATLELDIRRGNENGPPAEGVSVTCFGRMFGEESTGMTQTVDGDGSLTFGPMLPGTYRLNCEDSHSGLYLQSGVTLFASGEPVRTVIIAPDIEPREVTIQFDQAVSRDETQQLLAANIESSWGEGEEVWRGKLEYYFGPDWGKCRRQEFVEPQVNNLLTPSGEIRVSSATIDSMSYPVRFSGTPSDSFSAILFRRDGEDWVGTGKYGFELRPVEGSSGTIYRATAKGEIADDLADWALYDEMTDQGLTVSQDLVAAIRKEFPGMKVVASVPVPKSEAVGLIDRQFARRGDKIERVYEILDVSYKTSFLDSATKVQRDVSWGGMMNSPHLQERPTANQRIVLSFSAEDGQLREFNNPLEVWGVYGEVEPANWPLLIFDSVVVEEQGALELGETPAAVIDMAALESYPWLFADVTDAYQDQNNFPAGVLFQWRFSTEGYSNKLSIVSAEAKEIKNENRRPVWLVLEPIDSPDETASNGQPLKDIEGRFHYDADVPVEVELKPAE